MLCSKHKFVVREIAQEAKGAPIETLQCADLQSLVLYVKNMAIMHY